MSCYLFIDYVVFGLDLNVPGHNWVGHEPNTRTHFASPTCNEVPEATSLGAGPTNPPFPPSSSPSTQEPMYQGCPHKGQSRRNLPLIRSLADGLSGNSLLAITRLLPPDHTWGEGRLTSEMFVGKLVHCHYSVGCAYLILECFHCIWLGVLLCRVLHSSIAGIRSFRRACGSMLTKGLNFESWFRSWANGRGLLVPKWFKVHLSRLKWKVFIICWRQKMMSFSRVGKGKPRSDWLMHNFRIA